MPWREANEPQDGLNAVLCACHIWTGYTDRNGVPVVRTKTSQTTARRAAWVREGREIGANEVLVTDCGEPLCVRVLHMSAVDRKEYSYRKGQTKLEPAVAQMAQQSGLSLRETAKRFGISPRTAAKIRDGNYRGLIPR